MPRRHVKDSLNAGLSLIVQSTRPAIREPVKIMTPPLDAMHVRMSTTIHMQRRFARPGCKV